MRVRDIARTGSELFLIAISEEHNKIINNYLVKLSKLYSVNYSLSCTRQYILLNPFTSGTLAVIFSQVLVCCRGIKMNITWTHLMYLILVEKPSRKYDLK